MEPAEIRETYSKLPESRIIYIRKYEFNTLTDEAKAILLEEVRRRKIDLNASQETPVRVWKSETKSKKLAALILSIITIVFFFYIFMNLVVIHSITIPNIVRKRAIYPLKSELSFNEKWKQVDIFLDEVRRNNLVMSNNWRFLFSYNDWAKAELDVEEVIRRLTAYFTDRANNWRDVQRNWPDFVPFMLNTAEKHKDVNKAAEILIKRSLPGSEDFLIQLLEVSRDVITANLLLTSENKDLEKAAREWALSNGYKIEVAPKYKNPPKWR